MSARCNPLTLALSSTFEPATCETVAVPTSPTAPSCNFAPALQTSSFHSTSRASQTPPAQLSSVLENYSPPSNHLPSKPKPSAPSSAPCPPTQSRPHAPSPN